MMSVRVNTKGLLESMAHFQNSGVFGCFCQSYAPRLAALIRVIHKGEAFLTTITKGIADVCR